MASPYRLAAHEFVPRRRERWRVGLNSVWVPIVGFPQNYLHQLPWWGIA